MHSDNLNKLIAKVIRPSVTVDSLVMCAETVGKKSQDALCAFLNALCQLDTYKAAIVVRRLHNTTGFQAAKETVHTFLLDRCNNEENISHLDLLAIAALEDRDLLQKIAPFLTEQLIRDAFGQIDPTVACQLLQLSLNCLPESLCDLLVGCFCAYFQQNNAQTDKALSRLLPTLVERQSADVLTLLLQTVGAENIQALYEGDLFEVTKTLILAGKGTLALWDLFFAAFFSQPRTPEQLRAQCLEPMQAYSNTDIFSDLCAAFYLCISEQYGADHPLFDDPLAFSGPKTFSKQFVRRYEDALCPFWEQPATLCHFLRRTAVCNPFAVATVQENRYTCLPSQFDQIAYRRLIGLFEAGISACDILMIFFSTDLRKKLPLEDVFYLAEQHQVVPEFLAALENVTFSGTVTKHKSQLLVISPFCYFVSKLHTVNISYRFVEQIGGQSLKFKSISYRIVGYRSRYFQLSLTDQTGSEMSENTLSWSDAVTQLQQHLDSAPLSAEGTADLAILHFSLDAFQTENDLNLLSQLLLDKPEYLPIFLQVLSRCKWNAPFTKASVRIPGHLYETLHPYRETANLLFKTLFSSGQAPSSILYLYFSSIYKIILPLNELLLMADRTVLLPLMSNRVLFCRLQNPSTAQCRLQSINCAPICSVENPEDITTDDAFAAVLSDFTVQDNYVSRIILQLFQNEHSKKTEYIQLFKYIAANKRIPYAKINRFKMLSAITELDEATLNQISLRMDNAISKRKSDIVALMELLEIIANANPFAFQANPVADQLYLKNLYVRTWHKTQIPLTATSMVLNATDIDQVRLVYLHTSIKFYLSVTDLIALLQERRPDLSSQLPHLFADTVFYATADTKGNLYCPWCKQNTLRVAKQFAGQFLHCHLRPDSTGEIHITVSQAFQDKDISDLLRNCLLIGYQKTPAMAALLSHYASTGALVKIDNALPFDQIIDQLKDQLNASELDNKAFAKALGELIRKRHDSIPEEEMAAGILTLAELWIQRYGNALRLRKYLHGTFSSFVCHYHSGSLGPGLCRLVQQYLDEESGAAFETSLQNAFDSLTQPKAASSCAVAEESSETGKASRPGKLSFMEYYSQQQAMLFDPNLSANNFSKHLGNIIRRYHQTISAEEMVKAITDLTERWIPMHKDYEHFITLLCGIHTVFVAKYQSNSLGLALCEQARLYMDGKDVAILQLRLNATYRKMTGDTTVDDAPQESSFQTLEQLLQQGKADIWNREVTPAIFGKKIIRLLRGYHKVTPLETMETTIAELIEAYLKYNPNKEDIRLILYGISSAFITYYQSVSLSLTICQQAYQYLDEKTAENLEKQIKKSKEFWAYAETPPENVLAPMDFSLPFETLCKHLSEQLHTPNCPAHQFAKNIGSTIHKVGRRVDAQEMEAAIAALTDVWIPMQKDNPQLPALLYGMQEAFLNRYRSTGFSQILCKQIYRHLDNRSAVNIVFRLKSSDNYRQYASQQVVSTERT